MTARLSQAIKHGTWNGYKAHLKRRELPCWSCYHAMQEYQKTTRQRGHCTPGLGWPLGPGDGYPRKNTPLRKV